LQFGGKALPHPPELKASWDPVERKRIADWEEFVKAKAAAGSVLWKVVADEVLGNCVDMAEGAHRRVPRLNIDTK